MRLLGVARSSNRDVADGYGPAIQQAELVKDAAQASYTLDPVRQIVEPATVDYEDRDLFRAVLAEAAGFHEAGQCDGLAFSRVDRLSRRFDSALQIALDCQKMGLALRFIREDQWLKPSDEPIQFVIFVMQAYGVDTKTKQDRQNLKAGQRRAAQAGKLPSGCGPHGMLGLSLVGKRFISDAFAPVVREILERCANGEATAAIARDLQARATVVPTTGRLITRNTVHKVLAHARRYTGVWPWGGIDIPGLIEPLITSDTADQIAANLKRNQVQSRGYGKRRWLSGRVFCGTCGRRYGMRASKSTCACTNNDPLESGCSPCPSPRIPWGRLNRHVWLLLTCRYIALEETLLSQVVSERQRYDRKVAGLQDQLERVDEQIAMLATRQQRLSRQHQMGFLSDDDLLAEKVKLDAEREAWAAQLSDLKRFLAEPAPPDAETVAKWAEWWPTVVLNMNLDEAPEDARAAWAELFDLRVTVSPGLRDDDYALQVTARFPVDHLDESPRDLANGAMALRSLC
jgi:DNA invertase Pin-like site-specific DNA recombinase